MTHLPETRIEELIRECQHEAEQAIAEGNPPFGCVIASSDGTILATAHNIRNTSNDPTAHAEIVALRQLGQARGDWRLDDCLLFANAESCSMCLSAGVKARITTYYFGAPSESSMNPMLTVRDVAAKATTPLHIRSSILAEECAKQIAQGRASEQRHIAT